ncbi:uncharacterized protein LOC111295626 [Durio zibethinus]|uniref:Uncharacterized protein LOC111295626 n=1 Tax=Durio zibethinus TaxID=66656 RepID=A0A6P5YWH9_DURZI|nr:uncharacterized protein LOC111295626 [Durio zibethinus]XP_022744912.1 uncharacterized protein LOC111295626 [Durio zibethinus]XP_022744913.1 uncharacterized protein LOC111295626 [Durio zibethinus]
MHAIKGAWVGQTFALAKCNESGGKKSRIRRSKEERKAMVESFIKKYQKSNNENFPSLNLTHKEVGGSFYIIREIVREIIQENRVLGPAKLTEGDQNTDQFLEQNPLGSISTAPKTLLPIQSNGSSFVSSHHKDASDESVLVTGLSMVSEYKEFDSEQIINGNLVDVTNGTDKVAIVELQVIEPLESDKSGKELAAITSKVTQITADVVVETFPLHPVAKPTDSIDGSSSEVMKLNGNLDQTENLKVNVSPENASSKLDDMNSSEVSILTYEKEVENNVDLLSENNSDLADKKVVENISDPLLESSDCSTGETAVDDTHNGAALEVSCNDVLTSETKEQNQAIVREAINASNGIHPNIRGTYTGSNSGKSTSEGAVVVESKVDVQHVNSKRGTDKTLDRINLESWKGTPKSAAESETNSFWAIFNSFIAAFKKFWFE